MVSYEPEKRSVSETDSATGSGSLSPSNTNLTETRSTISQHESDLDLENGLQQNSLHDLDHDLSRTATSIRTTGTTDPGFEIDWDGEDDKLNPRNWPRWYRGTVIALVSFSTWVVVLYSTSYVSGMHGMMEDFDIESESIVTLGITTYLFGLAIGSVVLAPLSEIYGRRPIYLISMSIFMLLVLPCALARSLAEVLVVRFIGALAGSAMIANAPGTVADIATEEYRALAFSMWSIGPMNGPISGPVIGGFAAQYLGWRWTNWLVFILAGVAVAAVALIRETYAPAILRKRAKRQRKKTGDDRWWTRYDQRLRIWPLLKVNLSRPFVLIVTEPICMFWDLYVGVVYATLYLCFVAYPIVFYEARGWGLGISGLSFVGIGVGTLMGILAEPLIRRMINAHKPDPDTGKPPPEAMVSVVCIASILIPVGQLWFAWTCVPVSIHWVWPIFAGIPFGAGNVLVFIYASNYLAGSYGIYAASALAGNTVVRSIAGGVLPIAGPAMYKSLNPNWAGTLIGLIELVLIPIPFIFYKYGHKIRMKSALIRSMQEDKERLAGKRERAERHRREEKSDETGVT
ncbi:MAG: hypothetical protein M1833_005258 [Piccolia ochrophora]|nr:MAG: hypothetical protein M1833_005258 [Piccolia ochrophora]